MTHKSSFKSPWAIGAVYAAVYVVFSLIFFGNIFKPIGLVLSGDFIKLPKTILLPSCAMGAIIGLFVWFCLTKLKWIRPYKIAAFFVAFGAIFIATAAIITSKARSQKIVEFKPEKVIMNGFIESLHNTPKEFQFYTHALAMKNQQCYAWSYRELDFYELPESVYRNVVPVDWLDECNKALSEDGDNE